MPEQQGTVWEALKQKIEDFKNYDPNKKLMILMVFALVISTLVVATFWLNKINYRELYSNLSLEDASKICSVLKEKKINYRLKDGGRTILVPTNAIHETRLQLAAAGLPKSGKIGFELFDKSDIQSSDFAENIKYIRALQGELVNTINHLDAVEDCRVNLSIPRRRIFLDEEAFPSASVVLKLKNSRNLTDEEVRGVAQLVTGCVEGMKVQNVAIMSTDGKLLSDFLSEGALGLASYQIRIKNQLQKDIEKRVMATLNSVLGAGKAVVKVNVEIKNEQKDIKKELYQPARENVGVIRSSRTLVEDYDNDGKKKKPNPGTTTSPAGTADEKAVYQQKSITTNYEVSRIIERQTVTPGQIRRMSVGVIIDSSTKISPRKLGDLKDVISSISGIEPSRGDVLTLKTIQFNVKKPRDIPKNESMWAKLAKKYAPMVIAAFAPLIILMILMAQFKKKSPKRDGQNAEKSGKQTAEEEGGVVVIPAEEAPAPVPTGMTMDVVVGDRAEAKSGEGDPELARLRETLQSVLKENPKLVATAFEKWVGAEK